MCICEAVINPPDAPIYLLHKTIKKNVDNLRHLLNERVQCLQLFIAEEKELCEGELEVDKKVGQPSIFCFFFIVELGELPVLVVSQYPSLNKEQEAEARVKSLKQSKANRCELIKILNEERDQLMNKMNCDSDALDAEALQPTSENVKSLEHEVKDLRSKYLKIRKEIDEVTAQVKKLWEHLEIPQEYKRHILKDFSYKQETKVKLEAELEKCKSLKLAKLPQLIESLRELISEYAQKCKKSEKYRIRSAAFEVKIYDEKVLRQHDLELNQLKTFYEENEEIFKLEAERGELKAQIESLLNNLEDFKARFKNRGGNLLKEEQERKSLERKLIKNETSLSKLIDDFQAKFNSPFYIFDEPLNINQSTKSRYDLRLKKPFGDRTNNAI